MLSALQLLGSLPQTHEMDVLGKYLSAGSVQELSSRHLGTSSPGAVQQIDRPRGSPAFAAIAARPGSVAEDAGRLQRMLTWGAEASSAAGREGEQSACKSAICSSSGQRRMQSDVGNCTSSEQRSGAMLGELGSSAAGINLHF